MTTPPHHLKSAPHPRLVPHDIQLLRQVDGVRVTAFALCERQGRQVSLDECRQCPRFARIDVHEAGYVLLCRSTDELTSDE